MPDGRGERGTEPGRVDRLHAIQRCAADCLFGSALRQPACHQPIAWPVNVPGERQAASDVLAEDEPGAATAPRRDTRDDAGRLIRQRDPEAIRRGNPGAVRSARPPGEQSCQAPPGRRRGEGRSTSTNVIRHLEDVALPGQLAEGIEAAIEGPANG